MNFTRIAADLICGRKINSDDLKTFIIAAISALRNVSSLTNLVADLTLTVARRDAEIEMLKTLLLEGEEKWKKNS